MEKTDLLKTLIPATLPLINAISDTFLKPKLAEIADSLKLHKNNVENIFGNKFNEYLIRTYEKYSIMNTIVFHNQQKFLKDLYVPLTLEGAGKQIKIDSFDSEFLPLFQRVLITDTAGMGKSTILKRIFLSIIEDEIAIPILIELRRLNKNHDIFDEILQQINSLAKEVDRKFLLNLIQKGDFIFLFDGYDEIPESERKNVTQQLHTFVNKAGNNQFVITSRPEQALSSFGDFREFTVKPLLINQAYELLKKYDSSGTLSTQLIKKLKSSQYKSIHEFLTNPLLVSLLFAAYEHKNTIPLKKHIFYRQVFDALFESHDLTKGDSFSRDKFSKLDVDEFHKVLRFIGFSCLNGKIEFTKDEILNIIKEAKEFITNLNFNESDFLKDLINTVPLFLVDGIYYKWSHKSLQEYFAAQFIFLDSKEKLQEILLKIYNHDHIERFSNTLDLYYSIDYKSFNEIINYQLLTDFFEHLKNAYKGYRNKKVRQLLTFSNEYFIIKKPYRDDEHLSSGEVFDEMKKYINDKLPGWSLLMSPLPSEETIDCIKVVIRKTGKDILLKFLYAKEEEFIKELAIDENPALRLKFNINENDCYVLNEEKKLLFNSPENFEKTNELLFIFNNLKVLTIDEKFGKKRISEIVSSKKQTNSNKLLNF